MHLGDLFDASLVGAADTPGLDVEVAGAVHTLTFGELDARANRMAHALDARGVRQGDRVAVYLSNRLEFLDILLATLRLGAVIAPINILYKEREIAHIVSDADPRLVIAAGEATSRVGTEVPVVELVSLAREAVMAPSDRIAAAVDGDDPAALIYTSGTTGRSKGAVLSHNNLLANTAAITLAWRMTSADRYLGVLPLFHVHGLANGVCGWLATGCRMRLAERFDRERAVELFDSFKPTLFFGVPTIYVRLLELAPRDAWRIGDSVRLFVSGSAPLAPQVFDAFRERFGHDILERYGMSETLMLISNPYMAERRPGTVGFPLPGVSVRLKNQPGPAEGDGDESGEVLVRGSNVFAGYWRNPEATAAAFEDGWFRTGDMASRSADGYYTLHGRATDLIISSGFNVYPREIEELLLELAGVRDAAVRGLADPHKGEVPIAYVVADDGFDEHTARETCVRLLASFKVPRAFVRMEALPRNALGKVQKHLLPAPPPDATSTGAPARDLSRDHSRDQSR